MPRFRYCGDTLFLVGCGLYGINRWLVKPWLEPGFMMFHFNDLWLMSCALPPVLWLYRRLGLRADDAPPHVGEIAAHAIFWSLLFEWIGPQAMGNTAGDPADVVAYAAGALVSGLWWNRQRWLPLPEPARA